MITVCETNKCNGCMACVDKCPEKCISIVDTISAYNAVKDMNKCINCCQCEKICPNNVSVEKTDSIYWKQGWAEERIRSRASSGGVASAISEAFINNEGYVASCVFKEGKFVFEITNNVNYVQHFAGSKYVKSNPIGIYKKISEKLKNNKVLFIGLPCQVAGLKNYVGTQNNLYTVDLICHGTPSPIVLERFLHEYGYELHNLDSIRFRNKTNFGIASANIDKLENERDPYMISFLKGISYTENCYSCQFATQQRVSDLTLGDSWGTEYKDEAKKGVSLILVQTDKGKSLLTQSKLVVKDVDYDRAVNANHQLRHPTKLNTKRDVFMEMIKGGKSIKMATYKILMPEVIKQKIKYILTSLFRNSTKM